MFPGVPLKRKNPCRPDARPHRAWTRVRPRRGRGRGSFPPRRAMNVAILGVRAASIRVLGVWEGEREVLLSVNVLAMADRKNLDDKAVVFDDAQGAVAADAVVPLA